MAESSIKFYSPACILLVYGIPGSGKTTLSRALLEHCKGDERGVSWREAGQAKGDSSGLSGVDWNFYAVHFDEFYPPDLRGRQGEGVDRSRFHLKKARQRVHLCLEHLINMNHLGSATSGSKSSGDTGALSSRRVSDPPSLSDWDVFITSLRKHCSEPGTLDPKGRIFEAKEKATILLLDDNMPLRSMRYEYYQLARKYLLGYAEVCIQCSPSVALERNSKRPIPIPRSTIESMEQSMELPEPTQHHWEKSSVIIKSDCEQEQFICTAALANICSLVEDALRHPVQPLPEVDTALKETCKLANLSSYVHQADNILRRCISQLMQKPPDANRTPDPAAKEAKAGLARKANAVRKQLLDEIRTGHLCGKPLATVGEQAANSEEFRRTVDTAFTTLLNE